MIFVFPAKVWNKLGWKFIGGKVSVAQPVGSVDWGLLLNSGSSFTVPYEYVYISDLQSENWWL